MQKNMPLGYMMENGKIQIEPEAAHIVSMCFDMYGSGKSLYAISMELTSMNIKNRKGEVKWTHSSISNILSNVKYRGFDEYEAIVSEELFEKIQQMRMGNALKLDKSVRIHPSKKESVFTQKLRCGSCGQKYYKYIEHAGRKGEISRWKCKHYVYKNKVKCRNVFLTEEQIQVMFLKAVNLMIKNKNQYLVTLQSGSNYSDIMIAQTENRIKELESAGKFSSPELLVLIHKRAELYYKNTDPYTNPYYKEKLEATLKELKILEDFDEELFFEIVRTITVYEIDRLEFEFINGIKIDVDLNETEAYENGNTKEKRSIYTVTSRL